MRAVDVLGFAGGFTLGTRYAGFDLAAVKSLDGFGVDALEANRHLLPGDWREERNRLGRWTPEDDVQLVFGNPPCSGFSQMTIGDKPATARTRGGWEDTSGVDAKVNECMRQLVDYAATVNGGTGPDLVVFESVAAAGRVGRPLMRALRERLVARTGRGYALTHVFMSAAAVNGAQTRKRYFFVAHRVPFGVDTPSLGPALVEHAIGDLTDALLGWEAQTHQSESSAWQVRWGVRGPEATRFDVHDVPTTGGAAALTALLPWWEPGWSLKRVVTRAWNEGGGRLPEQCPAHWSRVAVENASPIRAPKRLTWDGVCGVLTGGCAEEYLHPSQPRLLTVRELARLTGFPDAWQLSTLSRKPGPIGKRLGKGIPVQSGTWIATWCRRALEGHPGTWGTPVPDGEHEYQIDVTESWRR